LGISCSVIITSWNGRHLLATCLPPLLKALRASGAGWELILVDDASTDGTSDFVRREFPDIRLLRLQRNVGFVAANNLAANEARGEMLLLLNNDVVVTHEFLAPLLRHFTRAEVFAVCPRIVNQPPGEPSPTPNVPVYPHGLVFFLWLDGSPKLREPPNFAYPVTFASGAAVVYRRSKFLQLGCFDSILEPAFWEDVDVCYRAWKRGWESWCEPRSIVYHRPSSSYDRKLSRRSKRLLWERNRIVFNWKNITDLSFTIRHILWLPARIVWSAAQRGSVFNQALCAAIPRLPAAMRRRRVEARQALCTDRHVFRRLDEFWKGKVL